VLTRGTSEQCPISLRFRGVADCCSWGLGSLRGCTIIWVIHQQTVRSSSDFRVVTVVWVVKGLNNLPVECLDLRITFNVTLIG